MAAMKCGFLLAVVLVVAGAAAAPIDDLCGSLGGFYVTPAFCAGAFAADPASSRAGLPGLGVIAARLAIKNATAVSAVIQSLISSASGGAAEPAPEGAAAGGGADALNACLKLYEGVIPSLQWSAGSVASKQYDGAREVLAAAQNVAPGCDAMAGKPLAKENDGFSDITLFAHAVVSYLAGH